jgi:hypothetical protein
VVLLPGLPNNGSAGFSSKATLWMASKEKCMRKVFAFLIITLALSGYVWGQIPSDNKLYFDLYEIYNNMYDSIFDLTDNYFSAVPTVSTESRYSASRFDSYVGGFIDPRGYNPNIGTFFFLGGYPANNNVDTTAPLTPGDPVVNPAGPDFFFPGGSYAVSLGFGKTIINDMYLAAYYGGSLVNAFGQTKKNLTDPDKYDTYTFSTWRNKLAILFGIAGMGFRFDLIMNNPQSQKESIEDGKQVITNMEHGAAVALTWGTHMGQFSPYAKFGLKYPNSVITEEEGKKMTSLSGGKWAFSAGTGYDFTDHSSIWADFLLGGQFKQSVSGDSEALIGVKPFKDGGTFGIGLKAGYSHTFEAGNLSLGLGPNMKIGSTYVSKYSWDDDNSDKYPFDNFFDFKMGIDIGLRYKPSDKFAFYTGAGLQFLELNAHNLFGGEDDYKSKETEWQLFGIGWEGSRLRAGGELGFGMTFNPSEYLTFGFGLNSVLDNIVKFNIRKMTVEAGPFWGADYDSFSSWATSMFDGTKLDITVSVRVPPGGIPPEDHKSFKDYFKNSKIFKVFRDYKDFKEFRAKSAAESEAASVESAASVAEPEAFPVETAEDTE